MAADMRRRRCQYESKRGHECGAWLLEQQSVALIRIFLGAH
jgi:hypothetical protein